MVGFNSPPEEVYRDMPELPPGIAGRGESRIRLIMSAVFEFVNTKKHLRRDALLGGLALGAAGAIVDSHHHH